MKTLIVVDMQRDFYHPEGALYVEGGEEAVKEVAKLIESDLTINQVVFTVDWHTLEDQSFKDNGGIWPPHCIQHSIGASISPELIDAVKRRGFKKIIEGESLKETYDIFEKGDIPAEEEYGAFGGELEQYKGVYELTSISGYSCAYLKAQSDVIIVGLAGDYCVLETAKNLKKIVKGKLMMYLPGIASIDGGTKLKDWMTKENVANYEK